LRVSLCRPVFTKEMEEAAVNALRNERFVMGESVFKFEEEFARYCGVKHAVSTSSGTNALQLALIALGVKRGDKVSTTPASFIATANAIVHVGGIPQFSDINLKTYTIDPSFLKRKITRETGALIPVHLYGYPADFDYILEVTGRLEVPVVEDACQAHGAIYKGKRVGSLGDVACFSFYSKNLTVCGDGGMVVTDNEEIANRIRSLRDCGRKSKYLHEMVGYTSRLNTVNAAIGRIGLKYVDDWNDKRRCIAGLYDKYLSDIDDLVLPPKGDSEIRPVYHLYVVRTKFRDLLKVWLEKNDIECGVHYPLPIHLQPVYREMFGYKGGEYPKSEALCNTCLSLPMHPFLNSEEVGYVCEKIHEFYDNKLWEEGV